MKILIVGAGGVGGYFGARMIEAGMDITFLVRPGRLAALAREGLVVHSRLGNSHLENTKTVTLENLQGQFDLVLVSCKAHHLDNVIFDLSQTPCLVDTIVLPVLNGINQYDRLDLAFRRERVAGGLCRIAATLDSDGHVRHLNDQQQIVFGSRDTSHEGTITQFYSLLAATSLEVVHSPRIMQEAWRKFTEIAALAAMTCLMRAPVGSINRTDEGSAFVTEILSEAAAVSARCGYPLDPAVYARALRNYHDPELPLTASMLRDLEARLPTEAEHIIGDMYHRGRSRGLRLPLFRLAWMHMQASEIRQLQDKSIQIGGPLAGGTPEERTDCPSDSGR